MRCRQCTQQAYGGTGKTEMMHLSAKQAAQFVTITEAFETPDVDGNRRVAVGIASLVLCDGCGVTIVDCHGKCLGGCDLEAHGPDVFDVQRNRG